MLRKVKVQDEYSAAQINDAEGLHEHCYKYLCDRKFFGNRNHSSLDSRVKYFNSGKNLKITIIPEG